MDRRLSVVMTVVRDSAHGHPGHDNHDRFFKVGWPTLRDGLAWAEVDAFFVVLPAAERAAFRARLDQEATVPAHRSAFQLVTEESLCGPWLRGAEQSRVQMFCKLAVAARHVRTMAYLVLDDDCVLLRPFGARDQFADGGRRLKFTHDPVFHEGWWRGSAWALGMDWDGEAEPALRSLRRKERIIQVTPALLDAAAVRRLLASLGGPMARRLLLHAPSQRRWTEYTLYWLSLHQEGALEKTHSGSRLRLSNGTTSVWFATPDLVDKLRDMRAAGRVRGYFGVIQSNVREHTADFVQRAWARSAAPAVS